MRKPWITKAISYLQNSLSPVPQELNELDWKSSLSPKKDKLCQHLCAFANLPGGGFLVFGLEDETGKLIGIEKTEADKIVECLANLCRAGVEPLVNMDHAIKLFDNQPLLFVYLKESAVKPVHLTHKTIEDSFIRSGGTTRKASRQYVGALMLNSKTPVFEELHASTLKNSTEVMTLLDFAGIHALLKKPTPSSVEEIIYWLQQEKMIEDVDGKGFYITNFGALAAAHNLSQFDGLARKAVRVIQYEGKTKTPIESLFLRKLVLGIRAQASGKNYATTNAFGSPGRPRYIACNPTRGLQPNSANDSTRCRKACIFTTLRFVKTHAPIASGDYSTSCLAAKAVKSFRAIKAMPSVLKG